LGGVVFGDCRLQRRPLVSPAVDSSVVRDSHRRQSKFRGLFVYGSHALAGRPVMDGYSKPCVSRSVAYLQMSSVVMVGISELPAGFVSCMADRND